VNRLAAVIGVLVLVTGIVGSILHTGLFFVPALLVLAVGGVKLWREQSEARRAVLAMTGYLTRPLRRVVDQERSPLFKVAGGLSLGFPDAGIWQVDFFGQCRSLAEVRHDQMMAGGVRPGASACRGRPRGIPITLRGNSGHSLEGIAESALGCIAERRGEGRDRRVFLPQGVLGDTHAPVESWPSWSAALESSVPARSELFLISVCSPLRTVNAWKFALLA
jgi:hypothetical protein